MAKLTFQPGISLTTSPGNTKPLLVQAPHIANEPNGQVHVFYRQHDIAFDKATQVTIANYGDLKWEAPQNSLTTRHIQRFGVKHFPQIGAMAFYKLRHQDSSKLLCPVFIEAVRYKAPTLALTRNADLTITFTMTAPPEIEYTCWRIVMRDGETAFEYISYEETLTVQQPYIPGVYECYCIGYVGEGQRVSEESNYITTEIVEQGIAPASNADLYPTKATFQEDGKLKILLSNGTSVITDNVVPGSDKTYVTPEELEAAIKAAINDSWEAEY